MHVRPLSTVIKCMTLLDKISEMPSSVRISEMAKLMGEFGPQPISAYSHLQRQAGWSAYQTVVSALPSRRTKSVQQQ